MEPLRNTIWRSNVNTFLGFLFVGTFTLAAGLLIWNTAFGYNPIEHQFEKYLYAETQLPQ